MNEIEIESAGFGTSPTGRIQCVRTVSIVITEAEDVFDDFKEFQEGHRKRRVRRGTRWMEDKRIRMGDGDVSRESFTSRERVER